MLVPSEGAAPPASAVWVRRSAVELRGRVLDWCARRGSNPHGLAATRLSTWRVCLFRHERRHWVLLLLPVDDSNVALRGSAPRVLPLHQPGPCRPDRPTPPLSGGTRPAGLRRIVHASDGSLLAPHDSNVDRPGSRPGGLPLPKGRSSTWALTQNLLDLLVVEVGSVGELCGMAGIVFAGAEGRGFEPLPAWRPGHGFRDQRDCHFRQPSGCLAVASQPLGATGGNRTRIELLGRQPPEPFGHDRMMPRRRDCPHRTAPCHARVAEARCAGFEPAISGLRGRRAHPGSSNSAW